MRIEIANDIIYIENWKGDNIATIKGKIIWNNPEEIDIADIDRDGWIRLQMVKDDCEQMDADKLIQSLILKALNENPQGLTTRQIQRYVKKELKKLIKNC